MSGGFLIFAFNKYRDEIITAMASILEYFNDVYDVFKSEVTDMESYQED